MIEAGHAAMLLGLAAGLPASALFFAGLAWGVRRALCSRWPAAVLLLSFGCRAALLLGLALWLGRRSAQPLWTLGGYVLAFLLVRTLALRRARAGAPGTQARKEAGECN